MNASKDVLSHHCRDLRSQMTEAACSGNDMLDEEVAKWERELHLVHKRHLRQIVWPPGKSHLCWTFWRSTF